MPTRTTAPTDGAVLSSHRVATTVGALVVPLVVLGAAVALALSWRDRLPDPVASSWGPGDQVSDTSSLTGVLVAMAAPTAALALAAWIVGMVLGRSAAIRRICAGFASGLAVFVCGLVVGSLARQLDVATAHQARGLGALPALAIGAALVVGLVVAALMPGDARLAATGRVPGGAPRARLAGTAGVSWTGVATFPRIWLIVVIGVVVAAVVGALARSVWPVLLIVVTLALVAVTTWRWSVTIDETGVVASTVLPWPRVTVPLDEVEWADVTTVDPVRDFGGWGYRLGRAGRSGIVLRPGEALVVNRSGGRQLVVTVDNAQRGAALLNALVERTRPA